MASRTKPLSEPPGQHPGRSPPSRIGMVARRRRLDQCLLRRLQGYARRGRRRLDGGVAGEGWARHRLRSLPAAAVRPQWNAEARLMSVRRLAEPALQPASFAFNEANAQAAKTWIGKYPERPRAVGRDPALMLAQEQEGWVTRRRSSTSPTCSACPTSARSRSRPSIRNTN